MMHSVCCICNTDFLHKKSRIRKVCSIKCRSILWTGIGNPNQKYLFDRNLFKNVDTEEKSYLLGWIASDGHVREDSVVVEIHDQDDEIIDKLCSLFKFSKRKRAKRSILSIPSREVVKDVCHLLDIVPGKKSHSVNFPYILREDLKRHFIRGFFDGDGSIGTITESHSQPRCEIATNSERMRKGIVEFLNIPHWTDNKLHIAWHSNNCLDMLAKLYDDSSISLRRKRFQYEDIASWVPSVSYSRYFRLEGMKFSKSRKDAVAPFKARASDSGYDLMLLDKIKDCGNLCYYDTGIKIYPSYGIYFDMVPRSSLAKTGYILANSVGVLDRTYIGNIIVPLIKIDKSKPDIELPGRYVQIIPRPIIHAVFEEVKVLQSTERGSNGFGSSGIK